MTAAWGRDGICVLSLRTTRIWPFFLLGLGVGLCFFIFSHCLDSIYVSLLKVICDL